MLTAVTGLQYHTFRSTRLVYTRRNLWPKRTKGHNRFKQSVAASVGFDIEGVLKQRCSGWQGFSQTYTLGLGLGGIRKYWKWTSWNLWGCALSGVHPWVGSGRIELYWVTIFFTSAGGLLRSGWVRCHKTCISLTGSSGHGREYIDCVTIDLLQENIWFLKCFLFVCC